MSYDLLVISEKKPDLRHLGERLRRMNAVTDVSGDPDNQLMVRVRSHGAEGATFFISESLLVEADDIDEIVFDYIRNPRWQVELTLPASATEAALETARAAAALIAKGSNGAAFDPQADGVFWPRLKRLRWPGTSHTKASSRSVDLVTFHWIVALPNDLVSRVQEASATCDAFLGVLADTIAVATPVRFGGFEPFQGSGLDSFKQEWAQCAEVEYGAHLFFTGAYPCFGGCVFFSDSRHSLESPKHALNCVHISIDFDAASLRETPAAASAAHAFAAIADRLGAIYGIATLKRSWELIGNQLFARRGSEQDPQLVRSKWIGIPPTPGWVMWFHRSYVAEFGDRLSSLSPTPGENGVWIKLCTLPTPLDWAALEMPELPHDLLFRAGEITNTGHDPGAQVANRIPAMFAQ